MEQNKDQGGAVVRAICSEKFEAFVSTLPDGMKKNIDDAKERGESLTETAFSIGFEAGQGAAVRGEAVALPAIRYEHKNKFHDGDYVEFVVGALYGYLIKQGVPKAAYYFSRDEAADYVAQGYWTEASVPIAPVSARAADALDSQPTETCPECDGKGGTITAEWIDPVSGPECQGETCGVCGGSGKIPVGLPTISSQPTDGGVRNG